MSTCKNKYGETIHAVRIVVRKRYSPTTRVVMYVGGLYLNDAITPTVIVNGESFLPTINVTDMLLNKALRSGKLPLPNSTERSLHGYFARIGILPVFDIQDVKRKRDVTLEKQHD